MQGYGLFDCNPVHFIMKLIIGVKNMNRIICLGILMMSFCFFNGCVQKAGEETPVDSSSMQAAEETPVIQTTEQTGAVQPEQLQPLDSLLNATTSETTAAATSPESLSSQVPVAASSNVFEKPSVENIQKALKNAGVYTGKIDGVLGPKTKKAIESFQKANGLTADGKVGKKTWQKLSSYLNQAVQTEAPQTE